MIPEQIEQEAIKWIIRNNYTIQCLLQEDRMKEVLIMAYAAGKEIIELDPDSKEVEELVDKGIEERMKEEQLACYCSILVKNI